jgi:hypothetical protein
MGGQVGPVKERCTVESELTCPVLVAHQSPLLPRLLPYRRRRREIFAPSLRLNKMGAQRACRDLDREPVG